MRPWVAFFSRSGSEIYNLSNLLNRYPNSIVTNKQDHSTTNSNLYHQCMFRAHKLNHSDLWVQLPQKPTVEDYESILQKYKDPLVTLHGYLRILPKEICNKYEIYNLHPGNIKLYPFLKGKDPQETAFLLRHSTVGCVLHRVIPEVDEGEIIYSQSVYNDCEDIKCVYKKCADIALDLWASFFKTYIKMDS